MNEQLGKIKTLSDEYTQGVDLLKEHVIPQPEEEPDEPSDPSYFDKNLNKTLYTSNHGAKYYFTSTGLKKGLSSEQQAKLEKN